jgi:hypothetical protein
MQKKRAEQGYGEGHYNKNVKKRDLWDIHAKVAQKG